MVSPHAFSHAWRQLHVYFGVNSDWLVVLFTSVAIGHSNFFGFGFMTLYWKRSKPVMMYLTLEKVGSLGCETGPVGHSTMGSSAHFHT